MEGKSSDWLRGPSGPTVCRCCFAEGCYKDISTEYFWMGKREVYSEMLSETFDLSIAYAQTSGPNSNSRLICEPCISRLRDASEFKRQVQECERTFMQHLDPGRVSELEVNLESIDKEVKLEQVKLEKEQSDDEFDDRGGFDDDDDDDLDDQPLTKLASKVPKKESVDLLDLLDNAKVAEKRKSSTKVKSSPAKKAKAKKDTPKATASKAKPEKKKKEINRDESMAAAKQNSRIILTYSTAYPFKHSTDSLKCCFCYNYFDDPSLFRVHMDTRHPHEDRTTSLEGSRQTRIDITDLKCKICSEPVDNLQALMSHFNEKHSLNIPVDHNTTLVPLKLEKNRFQCVVCSKLFTGLKQLSRHTATHFMLKYVCDTCGSRFETSGGLNNHVTFTHALKENVCRHCKQSFPTASERKEHIRNTKACQPSKCYICEERFIHWQSREDHLVQVHGKERRVFRCTECDKVFMQRTLLYAHFKTTHTEENKCQFCDKQFSTVPKLQEHTFRYHTGERPYKCEVCELTFVEKQGLNRHMITHDDSKKAACTMCDRLFARRWRLKRHMVKHHPLASV